MKQFDKSEGFTLIELMIVVAIVGILTAVAVGFYGDNVISANRTDGRAALSTSAASLEKCKALYGAYNNANCATVLQTPSQDGFYTVATVSAASSFTLTATPVAGNTQANDDDCQTMTLTNTGIEGGTGNNPAECW